MRFKLVEESNNTKVLYRVGGVDPNAMRNSDRGFFFAEDLHYYIEQHDMLGDDWRDAKKYLVNMNCRAFDPIREYDLYPQTCDCIGMRVEDMKKLGIENESDDDSSEWGWTSTDGLAIAGKNLGYDMTIIRDIPAFHGYGNKYTEYTINNPDIIIKCLDESLNESKEDRQKLIDKFGQDLADRFFAIKHNIHDPEKRDLYKWLKKEKGVKEFTDFLNKMEKRNGIVYNDDKWTVYKISSTEMLNDLVGRHKIWCVQNKDGGLDWNYHAVKNGTRYFLYINKEDKKKYIMGKNENNFMEDGVWDENNTQVRDKEFIKSMPKVD